MNNKQNLEYEIINKYKEVALRMLQFNFPNLSFNELNEAVDYSILKRMKNGNVVIDNNYKHKQINTTVLDICEYILKREPIITSYGVMFRKHADGPNPVAKLIKSFMDNRKGYKDQMFKYPKGSEMFERYNLLQLLAKVDANAFYGACGESSCILYNLYVAASITTQGRSCISSAGLQFEMFLSNNVKFGSLNEVITFIDNVIYKDSKERKYDDKLVLDNDITIEECFYKIMTTCGFDYIPSEKDMLIVWEIICKLKQEDINRLFYKNNLYCFMDNKSMTNAMAYMLKALNKPYLDPNDVPDEIKVEMDEFCDLLMEYVYYPHQIIDRLDRYRIMPRNVCIITDTDSSIVSLDAWYRYTLEKIDGIDMKIKHNVFHPLNFLKTDEFGDHEKIKPLRFIEDETEYDFFDDDEIALNRSINPLEMTPPEGLRYSIVNILAHCLGNVINDYMIRYTKNSNSYAEDRKCLLIMKNEFLFKRVLLTEAKKNYASIQEVQEGNVIEGGNLDIKGLNMTKSNTNERTQDKLSEILYEEVLNSKEIDQVTVLKELAKFEREIYKSLSEGEKTFYRPIKIKSISRYKNPMSTPGVKPCIVWNAMRDESLPALDLEEQNSIDIVKLNVTFKTIEKIKDKDINIYNKLKELLNQKDFSTGINGIAIPKNVDVAPKWIVDFIDYTSIINDNIKLFPIEPLGLYRGHDNNNYTNIISL